jgi:hypothetical protein
MTYEYRVTEAAEGTFTNSRGCTEACGHLLDTQLGISFQKAIKLAMQVENATGDGTRVIIVRESQRGKYAPLVALQLRITQIVVHHADESAPQIFVRDIFGTDSDEIDGRLIGDPARGHCRWQVRPPRRQFSQGRRGPQPLPIPVSGCRWHGASFGCATRLLIQSASAHRLAAIPEGRVGRSDPMPATGNKRLPP